jgi:hypothetical protein
LVFNPCALGRDEKLDAQRRYAKLRSDLAAAHRSATLSGRRVGLSAFYQPAVSKAWPALRPRTNSDPVSADWARALWQAKSGFTFLWYQLDDLVEAGRAKEGVEPDPM